MLHQARIGPLGLSYRVQSAHGYEIHLVYNLKIPRGEISYTQNEMSPFRWEFTTTPVSIPDAQPSAHLVVYTASTYSWVLAALEDVLYGTVAADARMPMPEEILAIFAMEEPA